MWGGLLLAVEVKARVTAGLKGSCAGGEHSHVSANWLLEIYFLLLGLDKLHSLTTGSPARYEVRVDLQTANESAYAIYDFFQVASSKERYKLTVGQYRGTAGKEKRLVLLESLAVCVTTDRFATSHGLGHGKLFRKAELSSLAFKALLPAGGWGEESR